MKKRFLVVYEAGTSNYGAFAPDVPGCVSTGRDLEDIRRNMREALTAHLEFLVEEGDPLPEPRITSVDFAGEDPEHGVSHCVVEWLEVPLPAGVGREVTA